MNIIDIIARENWDVAVTEHGPVFIMDMAGVVDFIDYYTDHESDVLELIRERVPAGMFAQVLEALAEREVSK